MKYRSLLSLLLLTLVTASVPTFGAEEKSSLDERHKGRKTYVISESYGRKVQRAFEEYSNDNIQGAVEILEEMEPKKEFDKAYIARFLGNMYALQEGRADKAIEALKAAVAPDLLSAREHADSLRLLADLEMQSKRYKDALKSYDAWLAFTGEEDVNVYLRQAQAYYELAQYADMIPPADKAIAAAPKPDKNAYILKLSSYYERKDFKNSVKVLEQLVEIFPDDTRWWSQLGMFYMLIDDYGKALATMDLAYKQGYLSKANEIKALAQLYANNGVPFKSAQLQEKYLKEGVLERDKRTLETLANTYHSAKELDKAAYFYEEAAKLEVNPDIYRKIGNLRLQNEQYKLAAEAFEKALELGVDRQGRVYMSLAEAYLYLEDYRGAYRSVEKAKGFSSTERTAKSWSVYIKDKAKRKGVSL